MTEAEDRFLHYAREHRKCTLEGKVAEINKAYALMVTALRELRQTPDKGVAFLQNVVANEDFGVTAWAALYLLPYDPNRAIEVLEQIASAGIPRLSFGAEMTLQEWQAGKLRVE